ncbi:MAG: histone [Candidatus Micrarchaeota archaeon]
MVDSCTERFSLFEMDKILRVAGADRVDERASKKLRELLEDSAEEIAFKAKILARHAGRNNVQREDIQLAALQLMA